MTTTHPVYSESVSEKTLSAMSDMTPYLVCDVETRHVPTANNCDTLCHPLRGVNVLYSQLAAAAGRLRAQLLPHL